MNNKNNYVIKMKTINEERSNFNKIILDDYIIYPKIFKEYKDAVRMMTILVIKKFHTAYSLGFKREDDKESFNYNVDLRKPYKIYISNLHYTEREIELMKSTFKKLAEIGIK